MTDAHRPAGDFPESPTQVPIPYRILALVRERERLFACPQDQLADRIRATGFRCTCCGACCTRAVNRHVFILDREVTKALSIDPAALEPAPDPEFCDQKGMMYVSGYALRTQDHDPGSCWFLRDRRCGIYAERFAACRIYPHMLRRGVDAAGRIVWKRFSRYDVHGTRGPALTREESRILAQEVREYENAFLTQQISFLETVHEFFFLHGLRHDPARHRDGTRKISKGLPVAIRVFRAGELDDPWVLDSATRFIL
jgi:Fe-S-cluster containining protein